MPIAVEPVKIRNGLQCPVCNKEFKNRSGFSMHYLRKHDPKFEDKRQKKLRQAMKKQKSPQKESTDQPHKTLFDYMHEALESHGAPMRRADLIAAVRTAGFKSGRNDDAMTTSMSGFARLHPERGIIQPQRGYYALGEPEQDYRRTTDPVAEANDKPKISRRKAKAKTIAEEPVVETEVERLQAELHRSKMRTQELIMKMTELVLLALE